MCFHLNYDPTKPIQVSKNLNIRRTIIAGLWFVSVPAILAGVIPVRAQGQKKSQDSQKLERKLDQPPRDEPDDVVRVRTDLVQTTVGVVDKRGNFIDNLRAEDFLLQVDGKPASIQFFDRILNGTALASAGGSKSSSLTARALSPTDASRSVLFFVDDLHLNAESIARTRKMLANYIEHEMGENDQAVIACASGQLGFLQQWSSEPEVLRQAVERLKYRAQNVQDTERPRMTVFQALAIERGDADVTKYFQDVLLNDVLAAQARINPNAARIAAARQTQSRADRLVREADLVSSQTLSGLISAVRSSEQMPGRKLIVFVSDGFLVNNQNSNIRDRLRHVTDAAVKAGAVLYTIQASGLNTTFADASADVIVIPGTGTGNITGEDQALQDPLTELAADTGGKALLNANDLNPGVQRALRESNDYYLLAWRPEASETANKDFHRIEVSVKGRSDLSVLVQRGFFGDEQTPTVIAAKVDKPKNSESSLVDDLRDALVGKLGQRQLETHLLANYLDVPNHGLQLSVLMQVDKANESPGNGVHGTIDVGGVIYSESGKVVGSFVQNLRPEPGTPGQVQNVTYFNQFDIKPGLYQVRVAARDSEGVTGMALQWLVVPDLSSHKLALSSLLIGERDSNDADVKKNTTEIQRAQLKIDKHFPRNSRLRVLTFIYNASHDANNPTPKLSARIDLFHGNKVVVQTPGFAVETRGMDDLARIPYAGELNLASLARGRYRIRVTVIDLAAKAYASQEATFEVD